MYFLVKHTLIIFDLFTTLKNVLLYYYIFVYIICIKYYILYIINEIIIVKQPMCYFILFCKTVNLKCHIAFIKLLLHYKNNEQYFYIIPDHYANKFSVPLYFIIIFLAFFLGTEHVSVGLLLDKD